MNRRNFVRSATAVTAGTIIMPYTCYSCKEKNFLYPVRLGAPLPDNYADPQKWAEAIKELGYGAAYCPVGTDAAPELIKAFREEAARRNIVIAEAGVWNNLMVEGDEERRKAIEKNIAVLRLADNIGAKCCVNISGARGEKWDGPYSANYSKDTFDLIIENVRSIIDEAQPENSFFTLEPMPYMLPDSPDSYLELIRAIDRKQFAVHLDPVNMISSPHRYFKNGDFIKECFSKLGKYIKSIHAKDILIMPELTLHLEERRPGLGAIDYGVFLSEAARIKDVPFMLEHLGSHEEYLLAAEYVKETGRKNGIEFM
jgi:sugar phosphate isomerase/epimerase